MKYLLKGLFASVIGTLVALAVAEIITRALFQQQSNSAWNDRPEFYYSHEAAPNLIDFAYPTTKPDSSFRIAVVGDSFSFAPYMQFDDTFPKRLERIYNLNSVQPRVEVINYGVPRYSTSHEIRSVERALEAHADLVVLQITLNDPEIKPYRPTSLIAGEVNRFGNVEFKTGIFAHWKFGAFVMQRFHNMGSRQKYINYYTGLYKNDDTWNNFTSSILKIREKCAARNVPLRAVIFPMFGLPIDDQYPFFEQHAKIQAYLTQQGVGYLDLLENYRGLPPARIQVMPGQDFHPNEIGHRIAAEEIGRFLAKESVVPESSIPKSVFADRIGTEKPKAIAAWLSKE